jgi:hypothetical protein
MAHQLPIKKIHQLKPASAVYDEDLLPISQNELTKKLAFHLLKEAILESVTTGHSIEMRAHDGYLQWKYANDTVWANLIALSDITGGGGGGAATLSVPSFFKGDGLKKKFFPVPGLTSTDAKRCIVTVGGIVQEAESSFFVNLADGGSLIFDEAPPLNLTISIQPLQQ